MRVSGNGNAREFFKKHGVTDAQMGVSYCSCCISARSTLENNLISFLIFHSCSVQSEKKYSSKAAPEYKKLIAKLVSEAHGTLSSLRSRSRSEDANDAHAKGLDGLMNSLAMNTQTSGQQVSAPAPAQTTAPETIFRVSPTPVVPKGTLNISAAASTDNLAAVAPATPEAEPEVSAEETAAVAANHAGADALKLHKLGAKKPAASKKGGMGARKIVTNTPSDVRIESFESVEKRAAVAQQEVEDRKLAQQLQQQEAATAAQNSSSGRVAAMMAEAETSSKQSIYRTYPATATGTAGKTTTASGGNGYRTSSSTSASSSKGVESTAARDKYSSQKGISSDQYFGRDQEDPALIKSRLGQYSNSSAISSDMMYGRANDPSGSYDDGDDGSATLEKLKDSVAGFFDSFK